MHPFATPGGGRTALSARCQLDHPERTGFDAWTESNKTRRCQGIKLHLLLDAVGKAPCWHHLSTPNVGDIEPARDLALEGGAVYVFGKGYCDYGWWAKIDQAQARFVSRFKSNAGWRLVESRPIDSAAAGSILDDQIVRFAHSHTRAGRCQRYTRPLRRIVVARPDKPTPLILATNDLTADALEIAQHYRARWRIELFFKWIKQHLRLKTFLGRSQNAVHIQILTALIAYLLLALYRQRHGIKDSLWTLLGEIRATLFQRPSIEAVQRRRRREKQRAFAELQPSLFS